MTSVNDSKYKIRSLSSVGMRDPNKTWRIIIKVIDIKQHKNNNSKITNVESSTIAYTKMHFAESFMQKTAVTQVQTFNIIKTCQISLNRLV